ncbi:phage/plasmid primase, P4 family [Mariniblastus fucicola]|uniref:SF3 helicase domain-containing protein n=1 Tax=Mariniblastus fucicola TaxID=980251 RepID=A0A5B9PH13_9BACT|nr:phage/plasmid primase, P4 family [Mariniblastus fucicola]QEG23896.1 hypothetical protein MFFC18_38000 [Mariniblastus fucicola]
MNWFTDQISGDRRPSDEVSDSISIYIEQYAARLFPLKRRQHIGDKKAKTPLLKGWQTTDHDVDTLRLYREQQHGIGWALGPCDLVIDVDVPTKERPNKQGMESLAKLNALLPQPLEDIAPCVESPTGGRQYYLTVPEGLKFKNVIEGFPDIDIKSHGGLVVIAGSAHWQGGKYRFSDFTQMFGYERPQAPAALLNLIRKEERKTATKSTADKLTGVELADLLKPLSACEFNTHEEWFKLFAGSHHATGGSGEGLEAFIQWSTSDPAYARHGDAIAERWKSFDANDDTGLTVATIHRERMNRGVVDLPEPVDPDELFDCEDEEIKNCMTKDNSNVATKEIDTTTKKRVRTAVGINKQAGRTDNANARRFVDEFGDDLRFVVSWGKWIYWSGKRWKIDASNAGTNALVRRYAEQLWERTKEMRKSDDPAGTLRFVKSSNSASSIIAIRTLSQSDKRVTIDHKSLDSEDLLFNCLNGTFDLQNCELRDSQREDLITQISGVSFDASAQCPLWRESLKLIFDGDEELIRYVQVLFGYTLSGTRDEHILPICYGGGSNGKSTVWNTIHDIMGDYAEIGNADLLMVSRNQHPTGLADLFAKRFVPISEPGKGCQLMESRVKEWTGDAVGKARRMREDFWEFRQTHTFWLSTNHKPKISGDDEGIWRRVKLIPFEVDLREKLGGNVDKQFKEKLKAEYSGILNWAIEGWQMYQKNGLDTYEPERVKQATSEYRNNEDEIANFVSDKLDSTDPEGMIPVSDAYALYKQWNGKMVQSEFRNSMELTYKRTKCRALPYRNRSVFVGLKLHECDKTSVF